MPLAGSETKYHSICKATCIWENLGALRNWIKYCTENEISYLVCCKKFNLPTKCLNGEGPDSKQPESERSLRLTSKGSEIQQQLFGVFMLINKEALGVLETSRPKK